MVDAFNTWTAGRDITASRLNEYNAALGGVNTEGFYPEVGADFIVFPHNSHYHVKTGRTGAVSTSISESEVAIKEALDSLDASRITNEYRQIVKLKGYFPDMAAPGGNNGCIDIPSYCILDLRGTRLVLGSSVSKSMIAQATDPLYNAVILGGRIFCNRDDGQTAGHGIGIILANNTSGKAIDVIGTYVDDVFEDQFHFDFVGSSGAQVYLLGCHTGNLAKDWGLYMRSAADFHVIGSVFKGYDGNLKCITCVDGQFVADYFGGTTNPTPPDECNIIIENLSRRLAFSTCTIDGFAKHGVKIRKNGSDCYGIRFVNTSIQATDVLAAGNTYAGLRLEDATSYCQYVGGFIGDKKAGVARHFDYAIEEVAGMGGDYNYGQAVCWNIDTALDNTVGANSDFTHLIGNVI